MSSSAETIAGAAAWFGRAVRAERERQGYSATDLALAVGVRVATISDLERGVKSPSLGLAVLVCDQLGVTIDSLRPAAT